MGHMHIDREKFFAGYRAAFGRMTQKQVDAVNLLLDSISHHSVSLPILAYLLATTYHETARTMRPVEEIGKGRGRKYGKPVNGKKYYGRGYVQLTWDYNYRKATEELRKQCPDIVRSFEERTGQRFDLLEFPEQACDHDIAFAVLVLGSMQGWFTGKKLSDYINDAGIDFINARRVINGKDRAAMIGLQADDFLRILTISTLRERAPEVVRDEADVPPTSNLQSASSPSPSSFTRIGAAVTGLTGLGINLGAMVETQVNRLTPGQVLYLCLSLALVGLAVFWYRQSANNAHRERMSKP